MTVGMRGLPPPALRSQERGATRGSARRIADARSPPDETRLGLAISPTVRGDPSACGVGVAGGWDGQRGRSRSSRGLAGQP